MNVAELLLPELKFFASRSSGAGGQHVNKVNTRVELRFNVPGSKLLSAGNKEMILSRIGTRITTDGDLILVSDKTRSQVRNRQDCIERFVMLIGQALVKETIRIPTQPGKLVKEKRLEIKRKKSQKKQNRKKPDL